MSRSSEEQSLLAKLTSGILDGMVGEEHFYGIHKHVFCDKYIKDGEPVSYRVGDLPE